MSVSWYICEFGSWKPIAGPPMRISMSTPVSCPPLVTSGPRTAFRSVSTS